MDLGLIIGIIAVIAVVALGWLGVPLLKKKGWFSQDKVDTTEQILQLMNLILNNIDIQDKAKDTALIVLDVAEVAVQYVEQVAKYEDNAKKKEIAKNAVIKTLKTMEIEITEDIESMIELGIESAVGQLPKTYQ